MLAVPLIAVLPLAAPSFAAPQKHDVTGLLLAVDPSRQSITVSCRARVSVNDGADFPNTQTLDRVAQLGAQSGRVDPTHGTAVGSGRIDGEFFGKGGEVFAVFQTLQDFISLSR